MFVWMGRRVIFSGSSIFEYPEYVLWLYKVRFSRNRNTVAFSNHKTQYLISTNNMSQLILNGEIHIDLSAMNPLKYKVTQD